MTPSEFITFCRDGRKDFSGENLLGVDAFRHIIELTHPELFSRKISDLVREESESLLRPIRGLTLADGIFSDAVLVGANFQRAQLSGCDLSGVDARNIKLAGANLEGANLDGADLRYSNLNNANLTGANIVNVNFDHCSLQRANFCNTVVCGVSAEQADFRHALFNGATINNCSFLGTNFSSAKLTATRLTNSYFTGASFSASNFKDVHIENVAFADIHSKGLSFVNVKATNSRFHHSRFAAPAFQDCALERVSFANSELIDWEVLSSRLVGVDFTGSTLRSATLEETSIEKALLAFTTIVNTDLSAFIRSDQDRHRRGNYIDYLSVARTISNNPSDPLAINAHSKLRIFLIQSGMPEIAAMYLIDSIRSLQPDQLRNLMRSTFISYGTPDEAFAAKLNEDLSNNGVATFFFPLDAPFGEKLHATMRRVEKYDRTILVCSERSLNRKGLQNELEKVLEREARDGGAAYLIPITLDDYLFDGWKPREEYLRQEVLSRVVADFSVPASYSEQFARLLQCLKAR